VSLESSPVKAVATNGLNRPSFRSDTTGIEVICYTDTYEESVTLAEAVRHALDGVSGEIDDLRMRSCYLTDNEEYWQDDAYCQRLIFTVKI